LQEPLPEPTAAELAKEAEQEAAVFAQAVNVDKLLTMLRGLDPAKDNLADNEEIQVCAQYYKSSNIIRIFLNLGTVPIEHGIAPQNRKIDRQVQSKTRYVTALSERVFFGTHKPMQLIWFQ
jgi:hypothetical protein